MIHMCVIALIVLWYLSEMLTFKELWKLELLGTSCAADLQLAAELGKALLERNVELESQLHTLQQTSSEQESEITVSQLVNYFFRF